MQLVFKIGDKVRSKLHGHTSYLEIEEIIHVKEKTSIEVYIGSLARCGIEKVPPSKHNITFCRTLIKSKIFSMETGYIWSTGQAYTWDGGVDRLQLLKDYPIRTIKK